MPFYNLKNKLNKKSMAKVIIVRHGHTNLNNESDKSEDRIRGWLNVPLNEEGREDAEKTAKELKNEDIKVIYSSDLIRAVETSKIIDQHHDVEIVKTMNLRPWNLGVMNGQYTKDVLPEMTRLVKDEKEAPKDGESFRSFRIRYLSYLEKIIQHAIDKNIIVLVSAHFRNLKIADAWQEKGFPSDLSIGKEVFISDKFKPGECLELDLSKFLKR